MPASSVRLPLRLLTLAGLLALAGAAALARGAPQGGPPSPQGGPAPTAAPARGPTLFVLDGDGSAWFVFQLGGLGALNDTRIRGHLLGRYLVSYQVVPPPVSAWYFVQRPRERPRLSGPPSGAELVAFDAPGVRRTYTTAAVWPAEVAVLADAEARCPAAVFNVTLGEAFLGLRVALRSFLPLEVIISAERMRMIAPPALGSDLEPPGPPAGRFHVYTLGFLSDGAMHQTMRDVAAYVHESDDYLAQLSAAHAAALAAVVQPGPYYFYRAAVRLGVAAFVFSEAARRDRRASAPALLRVESDARLLSRLLMRAAGCPAGFAGLFDGRAERVPVAPADQLRAAWTFGEDPAPRLDLARATVAEAYRRSVRGKPFDQQALFFAVALLLRAGGPGDARETLLRTTAMCTAERAAAAAELTRAALSPTAAWNEPFSLLDGLSPCAVSLRRDLGGDATLANLGAAARLALAPAGPPGAAAATDEGAEEEEDPVARAAPEIPAEALLALPLRGGASFVFTRRRPDCGPAYTLGGVDIANPLVLALVSNDSAACDYTDRMPESQHLPATDNPSVCVYCDCVFVRYSSAGTILETVLIESKDMEEQLMAGANSTIPSFNPTLHGGDVKALMLFPNGTVVDLLSFTSTRLAPVSPAYVVASVVGAAITVGILYALFKMLCSFSSEGYSRLINARS
uniref:Glycoprotein H n=1 Tax=Suid herpesvirus 1 TaxID=10345 RepID=A0A0F6VPN4_SUHV|nr:glycoprotein H [Suid alphaherpesvirus 1]